LVGLVLGGYLARKHDWGSAVFGKEPATARARLDYWAATWQMIRDHPWLGVGPGNFTRFYPRYMRPTAAEEIADPHNFALEVWAAAGVFALGALLIALGAFFGRVGSSVRRSRAVAGGSGEQRQPDYGQRINVEFYVGGMIGLVLALLLNAPGKGADMVIVEGVTMAVLATIWFAAFALLEGVPWSGPRRALVLATGVAALLLNLTVSGGISFPSVALFLWVMAALALNALPSAPTKWAGRSWVAQVLAVPILAAVWLIYLFQFFLPITEAAHLARGAQAEAQQLWEAQDASPERTVREPRDFFVTRHILPPLRRAATEVDPTNADLRLQLAHWYADVWKANPVQTGILLEAVANAREVHGSLENRDKMSGLDPENKAGYLAGARFQTMFADWLGRQSGDDQQQRILIAQQKHYYQNAVELLDEAVRRDPNSARLRHEYAEVLFQLERITEELRRLAFKEAQELQRSGDAKGAKEREILAGNAAKEREMMSRQGRSQAQRALGLDRQAPAGPRKLTDQQREQVRKWLAVPSAP
jgi:hypothetical protein